MVESLLSGLLRISQHEYFAGGMGRNLIPSEVPHLEEEHSFLPEPLKVSYGAVALPHPEKIADGGPKAVNKKSEGWGGEDAYFCTDERCFHLTRFKFIEE